VGDSAPIRRAPRPQSSQDQQQPRQRRQKRGAEQVVATVSWPHAGAIPHPACQGSPCNRRQGSTNSNARSSCCSTRLAGQAVDASPVDATRDPRQARQGKSDIGITQQPSLLLGRAAPAPADPNHLSHNFRASGGRALQSRARAWSSPAVAQPPADQRRSTTKRQFLKTAPCSSRPGRRGLNWPRPAPPVTGRKAASDRSRPGPGRQEALMRPVSQQASPSNATELNLAVKCRPNRPAAG